MVDQIMTAGDTGEALGLGAGLSVSGGAGSKVLDAAAVTTSDYIGLSLTTVAGESIAAGDVVGVFRDGVRKGFGLRAVGSEVDSVASLNCYYVAICSLSNTLFVMLYRKSTDGLLYAKAFTVNSDWTTTEGAEVAASAATVHNQAFKVRKVNSTTFAYCWVDAGATMKGYCRGGTVDATPTITLDAGGAVLFHDNLTCGAAGAPYPNSLDMKLTTTDTLLFVYCDGGDSYYGRMVMATLVGSAITVDTAHEARFAGAAQVRVAAIATKTATRAEIVYYNATAGSASNVLVLISGTTPTVGTPYAITTANMVGVDACPSGTPEGIFFSLVSSSLSLGNFAHSGIGYGGNSNLSYALVTQVTAFSPGGRTVCLAINPWMYLASYTHDGMGLRFFLFKASIYGFQCEPIITTVDGYQPVDHAADLSLDGKILAVCYSDRNDSYHVHYQLYDVGVPIGIAQAANNGGESLGICVKGMSDVHSGLTQGDWYYMDQSGSISSGVAAFNGFPVGYAYSATQIIVQQAWDHYC
jgi:hypothetical protein